METKRYRVLGLMSGTSLDGLDFALCNFFYNNKKWQFELDCVDTCPYNSYWKDKLSNACFLPAEELLLLHKEYGSFLGNESIDFLSKNKTNVDFVASHGHTVFHQPEKGISLQIGDGCKASLISNLPFVCDFRTKDIYLGGQGAPLVPIGDQLLFSDFDYCLNIGGIANTSFTKHGKRLAYDVCVANMGLNYLCRYLQLEYDKDGEIASTSKVFQPLLGSLNALDYYSTPFPKSLGREWFENEMIPLLNNADCSTKDKISTLTEHIAFQIASQLDQKVDSEILITGGGAHNKYLISRIAFYARNRVVIPSSDIINFKEALIFAFLGILKWRGENNCLASVTGACRDNCGGQIYFP